MRRAPMRRDGLVVEQHNATGRVSFWERRGNQSVADRHGISLVDYIHAMYGFLRQARSRRVLMIGCGGGTLAIMLRRAGVSVTIVDIDARNFEIARTYFHMPADVECHAGDGRAFLRREPRRFDAIVLDAYTDNAMPSHFLGSAFFDLAKARLRPRGGLLLVNLMASTDKDLGPDRAARLMMKTWSQVRLFDCEGRDGRNVVAAAGAVRKLKQPRLTLRPSRSAKTLAAELRAMDFRAIR